MSAEKVSTQLISPELYVERGRENTSFLIKSAICAICLAAIVFAALQLPVFSSQNTVRLLLVGGSVAFLGSFYMTFQHLNKESFDWKKLLLTVFVFSLLVAGFCFASFTHNSKDSGFANLTGLCIGVGATLIAEFLGRWKFGLGAKEPLPSAPLIQSQPPVNNAPPPVALETPPPTPEPVTPPAPPPTPTSEAPQEPFLDWERYSYNSCFRLDREVLVCTHQKRLSCFKPLQKSKTLFFRVTESQNKEITAHIQAGRCYFQYNDENGIYWIYSTNPSTVPAGYVEAVNLDTTLKFSQNYQSFEYRNKTILVPHDEELPDFLKFRKSTGDMIFNWEETQTKRDAVKKEHCCFYNKEKNIWFYSKNQFKVPIGCTSFTLGEMMSARV